MTFNKFKYYLTTEVIVVGILRDFESDLKTSLTILLSAFIGPSLSEFAFEEERERKCPVSCLSYRR